mmetsp:Transcript_3467/g.9712  ORF Transcript_3467/g.9712 Transcript_3467/m.9712 type:complete len:89 (+) Transcript_3467:369-635(+)
MLTRQLGRRPATSSNESSSELVLLLLVLLLMRKQTRLQPLPGQDTNKKHFRSTTTTRPPRPYTMQIFDNGTRPGGFQVVGCHITLHYT